MWLSQWNARWNAYSLVGGHKRPEETFRECLIREMQEELFHLVKEDFAIPNEPIIHLEFERWSESAIERTMYKVELFKAEIIDYAFDRILRDPDNRLLQEDEILAHQTFDQKKVSSTVEFLLRKAGFLR